MTEADGEVRALEPVEVVVRLTAERMAARAALASGLTGQCSVRSIAGEGRERGLGGQQCSQYGSQWPAPAHHPAQLEPEPEPAETERESDSVRATLATLARAQETLM